MIPLFRGKNRGKRLNIKINNLKLLETNLSERDFKNVNHIINEMVKEEISLEGWVLEEIPIEGMYCFSNERSREAFDFGFNSIKLFVPYYYDGNVHGKTTLFPTNTIKEAIQKYQ